MIETKDCSSKNSSETDQKTVDMKVDPSKMSPSEMSDFFRIAGRHLHGLASACDKISKAIDSLK